MFDETRSVNSLVSKVEDLLEKYEKLKEQNEILRAELVSYKAQSEAKDSQIEKLREDLRTKEQESDDIFGKIEAVLGK